MLQLDLFSGIGGFALAASWVWGKDHKIVAFCEIDDFCRRVLNYHFPGVLIVENIKWMKDWLSREGFPAKMFQLQPQTVSELPEIEAVFGKKCVKLLGIYDPIMQSWKMSPGSEGGSVKSSEIWPESGLMHNGTAYQVQTLVHPTKEKEYGLWPTPRASQDYKPIRLRCPSEKTSMHGVQLVVYIGERWPHLIGQYLTGGLQAVMMGLPENWCAVPLETPLFRRLRR